MGVDQAKRHNSGGMDDSIDFGKKKELSVDNRENSMEIRNRSNRITPTELAQQLMPYDVISFDIFDTAIYRKVDMPNDVFSIMAMETGQGDFINVRKTAENLARERKELAEGTREVSLSEIYDVLEEDYGIEREVMEREIELEAEICTVNPYIFYVYKKLLDRGKTVIFTSDMYLPQSIIEKILMKNGYKKYEKLFLSNSYKLRKGDGTLQKVILKEYPDKNIIHIGDSEIGDVERFKQAGLDALFNIDAREIKPDETTDNLAGSIYRAVINNHMYSGLWDKSIYYSHGFEVGGILAIGYCEYINQIARSKNIDKILFCSRDCEIIWKIYNRFYKEYENEYIEISRYAIMGVSLERYLYDWAERFIFRYIGPDSLCAKENKTVAEVLQEAGVAYLIDYLAEMEIDGTMPAGQIRRGLIKRFIFSHADIIHRYNRENVKSAEQYYRKVIKNFKKVLVVDIGWSGTCIIASKYFIETHLSETSCEVFGALMCTTRGKALTACMEKEVLSSYIYSPYHNIELLEFMISEELSYEELDYRHLALEYLFTSAAGTLIKYDTKDDGRILFERAEVKPDNAFEIQEMQEGMLRFAKLYQEYSEACGKNFNISPYVAFRPLLSACQNRDYIREVYGNFMHDSLWRPYEKRIAKRTFGDCFTE